MENHCNSPCQPWAGLLTWQGCDELTLSRMAALKLETTAAGYLSPISDICWVVEVLRGQPG